MEHAPPQQPPWQPRVFLVCVCAFLQLLPLHAQHDALNEFAKNGTETKITNNSFLNMKYPPLRKYRNTIISLSK